MLRYETLFLAVPEITVDEVSALETQLDKLVQSAQGTVISFEKWGKFKLAYPVRKYDYGVYFLMRFEASEDQKNQLISNLKNFFGVKQADLVMRHTIQKLDPAGSLEYKRPESLEEIPTRDVDSFLKENKMTGLMDKSRSPRESVTSESGQEALKMKKPAADSLEADQEELAEETAAQQ